VIPHAAAALAVVSLLGSGDLEQSGATVPSLVPQALLNAGPVLRPRTELAASGAASLESPEVLAQRAEAARRRTWVRAFRSARAYARGRLGRVSFAFVDDIGRLRTFRGQRTFYSASLVKAMLLVSYLRRPEIRARTLSGSSRALLHPMITRSDNDAATRVRDIVGNPGLAALARRVGMRSFASAVSWGDTNLSAGDQAVFFYGIDRFVPPRHRAYAMSLLSHVIPGQRWGVPEVVPHGERVFFKGGWRPSAGGWIVNQAALVSTPDGRRMALAVMSDHDRTEGYGHETVRGLAARLLRGFAPR
jgi:hypothetical protein